VAKILPGPRRSTLSAADAGVYAKHGGFMSIRPGRLPDPLCSGLPTAQRARGNRTDPPICAAFERVAIISKAAQIESVLRHPRRVPAPDIARPQPKKVLDAMMFAREDVP
jgi:hypothetical protein